MTQARAKSILIKQIEQNQTDHFIEMEKGFKQWRLAEFFQMTFSIWGLVIQCLAYENALDTGGFDGIKHLHGDEEYGDPILDQAIEMRLSHPYTKYSRYVNCILAALTITCLTLRNFLKAKWYNEYFSKQLIRENLSKSNNNFYTLERKEIFINFHDEADRQRRDSGVFIYQTFTYKYFFEILMHLTFPWPFFDKIILIPQLSTCELNNVAYYLSDFLLVFMFARFYSVIRHYQRYHEYTDNFSLGIC